MYACVCGGCVCSSRGLVAVMCVCVCICVLFGKSCGCNIGFGMTV